VRGLINTVRKQSINCVLGEKKEADEQQRIKIKLKEQKLGKGTKKGGAGMEQNGT
jgi:hypothetical protein